MKSAPRKPVIAFAVNETNGFNGMLCVAQKSMCLIHLHPAKSFPLPTPPSVSLKSTPTTSTPPAPLAFEVISINLAKVLADNKTDRLKPAAAYEHVFGPTAPASSSN